MDTDATYTDPDTGLTYTAKLGHSVHARGPVTVYVDGQHASDGTWDGHDIDADVARGEDEAGAYYILAALSQRLRDGGVPRCGICGSLKTEGCGCRHADAWCLVASGIPPEGERVWVSWVAGHPHYRDPVIAKLDGWDWILEDEEDEEVSICMTSDRAPSHWMPLQAA